MDFSAILKGDFEAKYRESRQDTSKPLEANIGSTIRRLEREVAEHLAQDEALEISSDSDARREAPEAEALGVFDEDFSEVPLEKVMAGVELLLQEKASK